ncbi:MAG TPA: branched-chain amino acid ABC transporter permease/ATP-binding protein [Acidimicrobiales bacterium]|nr:branched-chain amino acid ABC transporter permease/ATP-binding protein [Acidimicrobiales bacterium]
MFVSTVLGLEVNAGLLVLGLVTGMTYGILAVGLILVYRSSRVINFAHGEIGAFGAAICSVLVVKAHFPYWIAAVAGVATAAAVGAGAEVVVVRRLAKAPRVMGLVATLGVAQFLLAFSLLINSTALSSQTFPKPSGMPEFNVGNLVVTRPYSAMLLLSPLVVGVLVVFLRKSRYGLAMRAAAGNPDRARMLGISAGRMSTMAWAVAGAVGGFTTLLIIPTRGLISAETLGPVLLLRALAPAVVARMSSLPVAMGTGIVVGLVDQVLAYNSPTSGVGDMLLFLAIAGALLFQARKGSRLEAREPWSMLQPWPRVPEHLQSIWAIRHLGTITAAVCFALAVVVGGFTSSSSAVSLVVLVAFGLMGLSLGVITGLGGQLSLGQFALAGVGATASYVVVEQVGNHVLGLLAAALATALASVLLGLPALRVRGLLLGVATLAFALASQRWLLAQSWMLGGGVVTERPTFAGISLSSTQRYYLWSLGVLGVGLWLANNVWRGGVGLRLRAVRDNEDGARAFGLSPTAVKLQGFAIAGVLAGLGGALYGHVLTRLDSQSFDVVTNIRLAALTVLGGIGVLAGPLLGALYIIGVPRFLPLDNAGIAATSLGWLLLILYFPGGVAELVSAPRRILINFLARRHGLDPAERDEDDGAAIGDHAMRLPAAAAAVSMPNADDIVLRASGLVKRYGGVRAVDGVDIDVRRGEILGLIGPNGAGKTTLFELLGGFTKSDDGTVELDGVDITSQRAEQRSRLGIIRSFQDAALFPTLTVLECVVNSFERLTPTNFMVSALGMQAPEKRKLAQARELVSLMGLDRYRNKPIGELSTGTRRIAELTCILALRPSVLLLDEPSSGIAQRETEQLGDVILGIRRYLGCTVIVIEHDIPLVMGLSDRIVAMDAGRVIAVGSPGEIRNDPLVVTSYLGGDLTAIERSGPARTDADADAEADAGLAGEPEHCTATTREGRQCSRRAGDDGLCSGHRARVGAVR